MLLDVMDDHAGESDLFAHTSQSFSIPTYDATSQFDPEESEDDNEIELELTAEYMANGYSDMEAEDFAAAEDNFRSALELAEEHDFSDKLDYGAGDITLILADCLVRQQKEEEALELLEPLADGAGHKAFSDVVSVQAGSVMDAGHEQLTQLKACHTLGVLFLRRTDTHAAEKRAQQAFRGRRKICGAQDPTTLESVQLLIDIYTIKNDKTKARAYRRFLEPNTKTRPGGSTVSKISAVPPVLPPMFEPTITATLTTSPPQTLERSDADLPTPIINAESQVQEKANVLPEEARPNSSSTSTPKPLTSNQPNTPAETETETGTKSSLPVTSDLEPEYPALELSDSIRAALQTASTASTLPSPSTVIAKSLSNTIPLSSNFAHQAPLVPDASVSIPPQNPQGKIEDSTSGSIALPGAPKHSISPTSVVNISAGPPIENPKSTPTVSLPNPTVVLLDPTTANTAALDTELENRVVTLSPTAQNLQPASSATVVVDTAAPTSSPIRRTTSVASIPSNVAASVGESSPVERSSSTAGSLLIRRKNLPARSSVDRTPSEKALQMPATATGRGSPSTNSARSASTSRRVQWSIATTLPEPTQIDKPQQQSTSPPSFAPHVQLSLAECTNPVARDVSVTPTIMPSSPGKPMPTDTTNQSLGTMSASQAAFALIFGSPDGSLPNKFPTPPPTKPLPAVPSEKKGSLAAPVLPNKLSSQSQETLTALPITRSTPESSVNKEASSLEDAGRAEPQANGRNFPWLPEKKLSMPSSIARVISSSGSPATSDTAPRANTLSSAASMRKKAWPLTFGKNKPEVNGKSETVVPPPPTVPSSVAGSNPSSRRNSIETLDSHVEPKRYVSLATGLSSQPLRLLNKELNFSIDRISKGSFSKSSSMPTPITPRTRQDLKPVFVSIKALRVEGKKNLSIDAAIKLLREYDAERQILMTRESELKKNMRESIKGLASTGHGYAPIHFFCDQKIEATIEIELLIEQGADLNAVAYELGSSGQEPFTPLQRAIENSHIEIVRLLVDADVAISPPKSANGTLTSTPITHPLLLACAKGSTEITRILLDGGAARLIRDFPHDQWHGNSLLHEACWRADTEMVKMLLDQLLVVRSQYHPSAGPDYESGVIGAPGQQDRFGATPMMYAVDLRDCFSHSMRLQKSARRKDCLKLLLEHDIHGDLHSQEYRDNIARVLSTKWTRGPGKGHSIFCYCDEAGDDELVRLLDPFRYQVSPSARCHAVPQCSTNVGSIARDRSVKFNATERQNRMPDFPELMSAPVSWPVSSVDGDDDHYELASNFDSSLLDFDHMAAAVSRQGNEDVSEELFSPITARSNSIGHGFGPKERPTNPSENSVIYSAQVA